jgi:hypothetical protein
MASIDEELDAAKAAKAAIEMLSTTAPNPSIVAALRDARNVAASAMTFLGGEPLNDARDKIGIALSILIRALEDSSLAQEKIDNANGAIEDWMKFLEGPTPRSGPKVQRRRSRMRRPRR